MRKLYNLLVMQYEDTVSVSEYKSNINWVLRHIDRLCLEYNWLEVGKPIKHTISGITRVSTLKKFYVTSENGITLDVGFGNIYYYEAIKPTDAEIKKFDGHCLIVK